MNRLNVNILVFIITIISFVNSSSGQKLPSNPCPNLFQYIFDGNGYIGVLDVPTDPRSSTIRLNIVMSLAAKLPSSYVGVIELIGTPNQAAENARRNKPIRHRVRFPLADPLPKLTKVSVNGNTICSGPPVQSAPFVTTIRLEHSVFTHDSNPFGVSNNNNNFDNNFDINNNNNDFFGNTNYETSPTYTPNPDNIFLKPSSNQPIDFNPGSQQNNNNDPYITSFDVDRFPNNFGTTEKRVPPTTSQPQTTIAYAPPPVFIQPQPQPLIGELSFTPKCRIIYPHCNDCLIDAKSSTSSTMTCSFGINNNNNNNTSTTFTSNPDNIILKPSSNQPIDINQRSQQNNDDVDPGYIIITSSDFGGFSNNIGNNYDRTTKRVPTTTTRPQTTTQFSPSVFILPQESDNDICGRVDETFRITPLVVGGTEVQRGSFPWISAIYLTKAVGYTFQCGGNLISRKIVISAAHCFVKGSSRIRATEAVVFLGRHNIKKYMEEGSTVSEIESIHIHDDYKRKSKESFDADIAILILKNRIQYNEYIRPVCLWTGSNNIAEVEGKMGTVVGWGRDESDNVVSSVPKKIDIPIVSEVDCLRSKDIFNRLTSDRTYCAGARNGVGPCNGDSGSGMIIERRNRWELRGLVSSSLTNGISAVCNLNEFLIFTDVPKFNSWINTFL